MVVIIVYNDKVLSFNVGDSRAIMIRQVSGGSEREVKEDAENSELAFIDFKFNNRLARHQWKSYPLSIDHKPDRIDEK